MSQILDLSNLGSMQQVEETHQIEIGRASCRESV